MARAIKEEIRILGLLSCRSKPARCGRFRQRKDPTAELWATGHEAQGRKVGESHAITIEGNPPKRWATRPYYRISYDVAVDSASNKLIYFAAKEQDAHVFVVGGQETGAYDYIFGITQFTPQGSVLAFAERDRKVYRLTISPSSR